MPAARVDHPCRADEVGQVQSVNAGAAGIVMQRSVGVSPAMRRHRYLGDVDGTVRPNRASQSGPVSGITGEHAHADAEQWREVDQGPYMSALTSQSSANTTKSSNFRK